MLYKIIKELREHFQLHVIDLPLMGLSESPENLEGMEYTDSQIEEFQRENPNYKEMELEEIQSKMS